MLGLGTLQVLGVGFSLIKDTITSNCNQNEKSTSCDNSNGHPNYRTSGRFGCETEKIVK